MSTPGATTVTPSLTLPGALWAQAQMLAQELDLSPDQLVALALTSLIQQHEGEKLAGALPTSEAAPRVINQGDLYWVQLPNPNERQPGLSHPYVVIQDDLFNHSRIATVVACALTSNLARISNTPGNVLLAVGEANLPKQSVVEVSKISTIDKSRLGEYIGSLTAPRIDEILGGMRFLQRSFFTRE